MVCSIHWIGRTLRTYQQPTSSLLFVQDRLPACTSETIDHRLIVLAWMCRLFKLDSAQASAELQMIRAYMQTKANLYFDFW
jgi:hypothetical protein